MNKLRIYLVDDHKLFREGLKLLLSTQDFVRHIYEASNGREFIENLSFVDCDVVLMDIEMPEMNGIDATIEAMKMKPNLKIIVLSMYGDEQYYYKMIDAGAKGFLLKNSGIDKVVTAIQIGIIINSPVAQQQTVLHCQNIRLTLVGRIIAVGAADRTAIVERMVVQKTGVRDFDFAAGHYDRTGSIAAVAGKQAVVNHRTASSHQIQSSGITTVTAIHGFARGVVSEDRIRHPDRPALRINGSGHIGILPIFLIHACAVLIPYKFAGIVVLENTVPNIHSGIVQVQGNTVTGGITVPDRKPIQPGVCSGLATYFNVDPAIFRILFVVLTLLVVLALSICCL